MSLHNVSLIECLCVVTLQGGQTRGGRANRGEGDKQCGGTNMGFGQAGGGDKRGESVSEATDFRAKRASALQARKRPAGPRIWARRALKF